jgi:hypothetical protein
VTRLLKVGVVLGAAALGVKMLTGAWPDPRRMREDFGGELQRIKSALAEAVEAGRRAAAAREQEFERELAAAAR